MLGLFKKRIPLNIDKSKFEPILSKLIELLTDSSNLGQAEWVERIKSALLSDDKADFLKKLVSVDMWGGSGAVWEVGGFKYDTDNKKFVTEIAKLTDLMKASGIRSRAAQSSGRVLKRIYQI
tara:strand:- start:6278 stop:6643 length:366 start_codon:yes stop_codon:yes gene_type:complete